MVTLPKYDELINLDQEGQLFAKATDLCSSYKKSKQADPRIVAIGAIIGAGVSEGISFLFPLSFLSRFAIGISGGAVGAAAAQLFENLRRSSVTPESIEKSMQSFLSSNKSALVDLKQSLNRSEQKLLELQNSLSALNAQLVKLDNGLTECLKAPELFELWRNFANYSEKKLQNNLSSEGEQKLSDWTNQCHIIVESEFDPKDSNYIILNQMEQLFSAYPHHTLETFMSKGSFPSYNKSGLPQSGIATPSSFETRKAAWYEEAIEKIEKFAKGERLNIKVFSDKKLLKIALGKIPPSAFLKDASSAYKQFWINDQLSLWNANTRVINLLTLKQQKGADLEIKNKITKKKEEIKKIDLAIRNETDRKKTIQARIEEHEQAVFKL